MQNRILGINHIRTKYIPNIFHDSKTTYLIIRRCLTLFNNGFMNSGAVEEPNFNVEDEDEIDINLMNKGLKWKNKEKENSIFI